MPRSLSYRLKVPLGFSLVIVVTALVVSGLLSLYTYRQLQRDVSGIAAGIAKTLARSMRPILIRDEVWQAFETILTPLDVIPGEPDDERAIVVLNASGQVFASSQPERIPLLTEARDLGDVAAPVLDLIARGEDAAVFQSGGLLAGQVIAVAPVLAEDGTRLGTVIVRYGKSIFRSRFHATLRQVMLGTGIVLAVLLPIGWFLGNRIAAPLVRLSEGMSRFAGGFAGKTEMPPDRDEIQLLGHRFDEMVAQVSEKRALEQRMVGADRLATVGRLTAGIAHEINNPLGGMLNAVNTLRRHGAMDDLTASTVSLLERGLGQIRDTVGALLVEAKLESRAVTREDMEDVHRLAMSDAAGRHIAVQWENGLAAPLPLPATRVRQVLLNLLLNAIEAASATVECRIGVDAEELRFLVANDGEPLPPGRAERPFEPFASPADRGSGLGLWVCWQIVTQLEGRIDAASEPSRTTFQVSIPLRSAA